MAYVRALPCLVFLVLTACGGDGGAAAAPDASADSGGPPSGWTCPARDYGDGFVCHCECGVPDPDCDTDGRIVSGCVNSEVCSPAGACTNCGNGHVDDGEACDVALAATAECGPLGYEPGQVPCTASCEWAYDQCTPLATCGNGMLDSGELCDGSEIQAGLDCADYGRSSGTLACGSACQIDASGCYTCGDGKVEGPEGCDDRDTASGDGCSSACAVETGWQCAGQQDSHCTPVCGDGMLVGGEACDDGNASGNDGCSASCQVEQDCTCSGTPSTCSCATVQLIATTTENIDTGSLALDGAGQPHATYFYAVDYTDPVTNYSMEHAHTVYAQRPSSTWTTTELATWDQTQTVIGPQSFVLAYDGGTLRALFQRLYNAAGTLAVATRASTSWQLAYANPTYIYHAIRGGSDWHAIVAGSSFGDLRYMMGAPGAWTRDESLAAAGVNSSYAMRLAHASNGDIFLASMSPASGHASYNLKLSKRTGAGTWSTMYDVATTSACVYPVMHEPLALAGGEVMAFEDGFNSAGQRWLRAHRLVGASWVVEDVADLSWLPYSSCKSSSASWRTLRMVTAADALGRPHILYASQPQNNNTLTLEDHYRDATGWHVRTFPLTNGTPLDMVIDSAGTTHLLALAPSATPSTTRILYIRISASAW